MKAKRSTGKLKNIPPNQIGKNPDNPRLIFRQQEMESLLVSIDTHGIQVPLTVYLDGSTYRLIDGERRWRCARKLNLRTVPALVQDKPSELENLLLMYNIHALREQWDYFTIASKLVRVIELYVAENQYEPNETDLSQITGLTRGQIRRCRFLLDLPDRFKGMLLQELKLPKSQQKLSEDFFIEMERSLKTITRRLPKYYPKLNEIRDTLVDKFRDEKIKAVTDFRQMAKIATAIHSLDLPEDTAIGALDTIFDSKSNIGIREAYEETVEFEYDEQRATRHIDSLTEFFDEIILEHRHASLDEEFLESLRQLYDRVSQLLRI